MSEVKRYEPSTQCVEPSYKAQMIEPIVREVAWGNYVRYEDYAKVKEAGQNILQHLRESTAENARLKAEVQHHLHQAVHDVSQLGEQSAEIAHLKAEVERLTKAGDAMASMLQFEETLNDSDHIPQSVQRWNAAKNGEPSV